MFKLNICILAVSFLFLGSRSMAQDLKAYRFQACQTWTPLSNGEGFVCVGSPPSVTVADATSFAAEVRAMRLRIEELEKKVQELEKHP